MINENLIKNLFIPPQKPLPLLLRHLLLVLCLLFQSNITFGEERQVNPTAPNTYTQYLRGDFTDTDSDGMTDVAEQKYGFDHTDPQSFPSEPTLYTPPQYDINDLTESGIGAKYQFTPGALRLTWSNPGDGSNYILKLLNGNDQLIWGGHYPESAELTYTDHNLSGTEILKGSFYHYSDQGNFISQYPEFTIDLSNSTAEIIPVGHQDNRISYIFDNFSIESEQEYRAFLRRVFVILKDRLGPPAESFNIVIKNTGGNGSSFISIDDGRTMLTDESFIPRLIIHEIVHAWKGRYLYTSDSSWRYDEALSGFEEASAEGMAFEIVHEYVRSYPNDPATIQLLQYRPYQYWSSRTTYNDLIKHIRLTGAGDFWTPGSGYGARLRYSIAATTYQEFVKAHPNFYKDTQKIYYDRINTDSTWRPNREDLIDIWKTVLPTVNGIPLPKYVDAMPVFNGHKLATGPYVLNQSRPYGEFGDKQFAIAYANIYGKLWWGIKNDDNSALSQIPSWIDRFLSNDGYYYIDTQNQPFSIDIQDAAGNHYYDANFITNYDRRQDGGPTGFGWKRATEVDHANFPVGLYKETVSFDNYILHDINAKETFYFFGYQNFTQSKATDYVIMVGIEGDQMLSATIEVNGIQYTESINNGVALFRSNSWPFDLEGSLPITIENIYGQKRTYYRTIIEAGSIHGYFQYQYVIVDKNFNGVEDLYETNTAPKFTSMANQEILLGNSISLNISATDSDTDSLTYSTIDIPVGSTFDTSTRKFQWTPTAVGTYSARFSVSDGIDQDTLEIILNVSNDQAPPLNTINENNPEKEEFLSPAPPSNGGGGGALYIALPLLVIAMTLRITNRVLRKNLMFV